MSTTIAFAPLAALAPAARLRGVSPAPSARTRSSARSVSASPRPRPAALELDRLDECVWRAGEKITLAPKAFALLRHLAEHRGRLVTKHDLLDAVWPGVFVGDAVLKVAVREIRAALGDDAKEPLDYSDRAPPRLSLHCRCDPRRRAARTAMPAASPLRLIGPAPDAVPLPSPSDDIAAAGTLVGRADTLDRLRGHLSQRHDR